MSVDMKRLIFPFICGVWASSGTVIILAQVVNPQPTNVLDPTLMAAAIVTVLAALGGVTVQIINAVSAARDRRDAALERKVNALAAAETGKKADILIEKTAEIHTLTNSTNSNLQKALELMTEKFQGAERALAAMEVMRKETAATQAMRDQVGSVSKEPTASTAAAGIAAGTAAAIVQTTDNTKQIEKNTAKTDVAVQQLKDQA